MADVHPRIQEDSLSSLLGGIDREIKQLFLTLPRSTLRKVFTKYGELYGTSKLIYAKNTYEHWKSGTVAMSGVVMARLLNLVPSCVDAGTRFELVKKLRSAHLQLARVTIVCDQSDWFKKVPTVVEGLIHESSRFALPTKVVEKLTWLAEGDSIAAHELIVAVEIDEANARAQFLTREYAHISNMLSSTRELTEVTHVIELPQGTVTVIIKRPKLQWHQRIPLSPTRESRKKRKLSIICKNSRCRAEIVTALSVYDDEPIVASMAKMVCAHCGTPFEYGEKDLRRDRKNLNVEVNVGFFLESSISYDCPLCSARLTSPENEVGTTDTCPKCRRRFVVPAP